MFKKLIQNNLHIFLLISFFFLYIFFCYDTFIMLEPRFDQVRHMAWLESLKESSHIINLENFKRLNDPDGFLFSILRVAGNKGDYHAYLFQINTILVLYFSSFFLDFFNNYSVLFVYNFTSIFFSSATIFICYFLSAEILDAQKITYNKSKLAIIICIFFFSYYKFYFSPLGNHNIANFFFLLTFLIYKKFLFEKKKLNFFLTGCLVTFSGYFQITLAILLIPSFGLFFLLGNLRNFKFNISNCVYYTLGVSFGLLPFFSIIFFTLIFTDGYTFNFLIGESLNFYTYFIKIKNWFFNFYNLNGLIIISPIILAIFQKKLLQDKIIKLFVIIISVHFSLNIILNIIEISYIRNYLYLHHIVIILSSVLILKYLKFKNTKLFIISYLFIITQFILNLNIILKEGMLDKKNSYFYSFYFSKNGLLKKNIKNLENVLSKDLDVIFYDQLTKDYFRVYNKEIFYKSKTDRNLADIKIYLNDKNKLNRSKLNEFGTLNDSFYLIAIENNLLILDELVHNLIKNKIINSKCTAKEPVIYKKVLPDGITGNFTKKLIIIEIECY